MKKGFYLCIKRIIDILLSLIGILLLIPITIIVKISYVLTKDYKNIFFIQKRIGLNGKIFKLIKFRSMVNNADQLLYEMLKNDKKLREEYNTNKKLNNDPRVTKVGKILRKTSLDELPQVINDLCLRVIKSETPCKAL